MTTFCWLASVLTGEWALCRFSFLSSPNVMFQVFLWNEIIDYLKIILPFSHNNPSRLMTKLPLMSHFIFSNESLHWLCNSVTKGFSFLVQFSSVQSLSCVWFFATPWIWLFATPWIAARQASLSITNSQSLLKLMPIESVMPSSHHILCRPLPSCPQSLQASGSFPMSQLFAWGSQSIGVSASASILPMNTQD